MNALIIFYSFIGSAISLPGRSRTGKFSYDQLYCMSGKITLLGTRDYIGNGGTSLVGFAWLWQPPVCLGSFVFRNEIFNMYVIVGILVGVIITLILYIE